jgi:hypothetical protein
VSNIVCTRVDETALRETPRVEGWDDRLRPRGKWLHLWTYLTCSHLACCGDSPNKAPNGRLQLFTLAILRRRFFHIPFLRFSASLTLCATIAAVSAPLEAAG